MHEDDTGVLPKRLRQLRLELGWTTEDVAAAIGAANRGVVSNWETLAAHRRTPPLGTLLALSRWYGVSLDYLAGVRGAERDHPLVKLGQSTARERFPAEIKKLKEPNASARLRLALSILQDAAPEVFFTERIAANLMLTTSELEQILAGHPPTQATLERFALLAGIPISWFFLNPAHI